MAVDPGTKAAQVLAQSAANLRNAHKAAVTQAAQETKKILLDEAHGVGGGRLRNVGRSGAKLGVGYEVTSSGNAARATVRARGPWMLVQAHIKPHGIKPRKSRGKRAVSFGGGAYARVNHPGVPGSRQPKPWDKGTAKAGPKVKIVLAQRFIQAVGNAW